MFEKLDGKTLDITEKTLEILKIECPEVFTEEKIDFDKLKLVLGENIETSNEKYEFKWNGKNNAIKLAQTPSMGTLRPDKKSSKNWDTTENLYIEGDNLEVLKLLQKSYFGKIKMIYIDPPYNTGKDFVYKDNFRDNISNYKEITNQKNKSNTEVNGRYHTDWLNMMYPRLKLAKNLLKKDGLIFISIGINEYSNCKKICDEIFGENNLISETIWNCSTGGGIRPKFFSNTHEYILIYAKNIENINQLNAPLSAEAINTYNKEDSQGLYREKDFVFKNASNNKNQKYFIICPDGEKVKPKDGYIYRFVEGKFKEAIKDNLVIFKHSKKGPLLKEDGSQSNWNIYIKKYFGEGLGAPTSVLPKEQTKLYNSGTKIVQDLFEGQRLFENPKPIELLKYLLNLNTNKDEIILDFFSGSSSTAHAVIQSNMEKNFKRKFIMVQLPEILDEDSEAYKSGYKNICEIAKERIRRAGDKIIYESNNVNLDIGFKVFKLDNSNLKNWEPDYNNLEKTLLDMEDNLKDYRTQEDLLYEILLKMGYQLTSKVSEIKVKDKTIFNIEDSLLVCLENDIESNIIEYISENYKNNTNIKIVFKDYGFKSDKDKMNAIENLKQFNIKNINFI